MSSKKVDVTERSEEEERKGLLAEQTSADDLEQQASSAASSSGSSAGQEAGASRQGSPKAAASQSADALAKGDNGQGICRICLEEDSLSALEAPCKCTGTQRYAHHACIQRWVDEKGNAKCEICEQPYGPPGRYTVPPAPLPMHFENMPLFTPMYILDASDGRGGHRSGLELLEADHALQRNSSVSWCITFIVFFMFLVVLHHTLLVADGMDYNGGSTAGGSTSGGSGFDPSPSPSGGLSPGMDADDSVASNLLLFLFWVATKAFLIGIPLYTVMKVASRQARREQYEAMMRAGTAYDTQRRMVIRVQRGGNGDPPLATAV